VDFDCDEFVPIGAVVEKPDERPPIRAAVDSLNGLASAQQQQQQEGRMANEIARENVFKYVALRPPVLASRERRVVRRRNARYPTYAGCPSLNHSSFGRHLPYISNKISPNPMQCRAMAKVI
jgi:hypothetical protein